MIAPFRVDVRALPWWQEARDLTDPLSKSFPFDPDRSKPHRFDALGSSFEKGRLSAVTLSIVPSSGSPDRFKLTYASDPHA